MRIPPVRRLASPQPPKHRVMRYGETEEVFCLFGGCLEHSRGERDEHLFLREAPQIIHDRSPLWRLDAFNQNEKEPYKQKRQEVHVNIAKHRSLNRVRPDDESDRAYKYVLRHEVCF